MAIIAKSRIIEGRRYSLNRVQAPSQFGVDLKNWTHAPNMSFYYTDENKTRMAIYEIHLVAGEKITLPEGNWSGMMVLAPPGS